MDALAAKWRGNSEDEAESASAPTIWRFANGTHFRVVYPDHTQFIGDWRGTEVWATWPDTATTEDTATYLLGPILGFVLRLRGVTCLHASAIAVGSQAIVLMGPCGAGKSSAAAAFARFGYSVLSDDIVALSELRSVFQVQPGYPRVNLWPDSVKALYGTADALPQIAPPWEKRYLDLMKDGSRFQQAPLPLAAVYVLGERGADPAAPFVRCISRKTSLMRLVSNTYANTLLDKQIRAQEFELLDRVVQSVPVREVHPHSDPGRMESLCEVILRDLQHFSPSAFAEEVPPNGVRV